MIMPSVPEQVTVTSANTKNDQNLIDNFLSNEKIELRRANNVKQNLDTLILRVERCSVK